MKSRAASNIVASLALIVGGSWDGAGVSVTAWASSSQGTGGAGSGIGAGGTGAARENGAGAGGAAPLGAMGCQAGNGAGFLEAPGTGNPLSLHNFTNVPNLTGLGCCFARFRSL